MNQNLKNPRMPEPQTTRRYCAFLSYRHADNAQEGRRWAEWLHRSLERYVVPPDLVGKLSQRGDPIPDSLYPIFRDEDELPAHADLATGIRRALEHSNCMIVLCSPRSAQSPWVRQEVREFKELGKSDRILAVILAGEPNADNPIKARDGIFPEEECFPRELRYGVTGKGERHPASGPIIDWEVRTEPLAADLRPQGRRAEGFTSAAAYKDHLKFHSSFPPEKIDEMAAHYGEQIEHARLQIIAGILGIPLSQLVDRDALHRAKQAEQEAQRQKEIAKRERIHAEEARLASERLRKRNRVLAGATVMVCVLAVAAMVGFIFARANKLRADDARAEAEMKTEEVLEQKNEVEKQKRESLRTLSRLNYLQAFPLIKDGKENDAIAYLARSVADDSENSAASLKLVNLLSENSSMVPTLTQRLPPTTKQVVLSEDGHFILMVNGATARICRLWSNETVGISITNDNWITSASLSPDGKQIRTLSGASPWEVKIWDSFSGQLVGNPIKHSNHVQIIQFSPDGSRLLTTSGGYDFGNDEAATDRASKHISGTYALNVVGYVSVSEGEARTFESSAGREGAALITETGNTQRPSGILSHQFAVRSASFSSDSEAILTVANDGVLRLWNALDYQQNTNNIYGQPVKSAVFVPNSKKILIIARSMIKVLDGSQETVVGEAEGLSSAEFSPDGRWLAVVTEANALKLYASNALAHPKFTLEHSESIKSVRFSLGGERILVICKDNRIWVWDTRTGNRLTQPLKQSAPVAWAQFSSEEDGIIVYSTDNTLTLWTALNKPPISNLLCCSNFLTSASLSPDGKRIVTTTTTNGAQIWRIDDGVMAASLSHKAVSRTLQIPPESTNHTSLDYCGTNPVEDNDSTPTLTNLCFMAQEGTLRMPFYITNGYLTQGISTGLTNGGIATYKFVVSNSADFAVIACVKAPAPGPHSLYVNIDARPSSTDMIWEIPVNVEFTNRIVTWRGSGVSTHSQIAQRNFHLDKGIHKLFIVGGEANIEVKSLSLLPLPSPPQGLSVMESEGVEIGETEYRDPADSVVFAQFSVDGKQVLTAARDNSVQLWDAITGTQLSSLIRQEAKLVSAALSPDATQFLTISEIETGPDWKVSTWEAKAGKLLTESGFYWPSFLSTRYVSNTWRIVSLDRNKIDFKDGLGDQFYLDPNAVRIVDLNSGRQTEKMEHKHVINSASFSQDGRLLVTASADQTARIWDAQTGTPISEPMEHKSCVQLAQFSPDNTKIVTVSDDKEVRIWDVQKSVLLAEPLQHDSSVRSVQFSPSGQLVLTVSGGEARVWDANSGLALTQPFRHSSDLVAAQFSPDERQLFSATTSGHVHVWDIAPKNFKAPAWLPQIAEAFSGEALNRHGVLEPATIDRAQVFERLRKDLGETKETDDWVIWGRWLLANTANRTTSPFSKMTIREYVERCIAKGTTESINEAEKLAHGYPELLRKIIAERGK